jgi:protocatechuate 3,4-dioxygenase beta subunit
MLCVIAPWAHAQAVGGVVGGVISQPGGQPPRDTRPVTGHSAIRGRVLSDTGQPVRRAMVRATAPETRGVRTASTDAEGRYELRDLPAGRYSIGASKPAFISWSYGQTQPNGPSKPVVLTENQTADNVDVRLPRGAVITGRIIDEFGDPVPNVEVTTIRKTYSQGQRRLVPIGPRASTNDIGEYRLFGLEPGQYYVSARVLAQNVPTFTGNGVEFATDRTGFASTFYPATADSASARALAVGVGQTISGIDIPLQPVRLATISGIALDADGRPLESAGVSALVRGNGAAFALNSAGIQKDGSFVLPNVPPGEYIVRAAAPQRPSPGSTGGPPQFSAAFVTVTGQDVSGVTLAPILPVAVSGRVVFDDSAAAQSVKPSNVRVFVQSLGPDDGLLGVGFIVNGRPPVLADDFTFEVKTAPGRLALRVNAPAASNMPNGWQMKSIRLNGVDVTDTGFDVGTDGARDIEIEMTSQVQQISGTVTDAGGKPVRDYLVALFPQDRARWGEPVGRRFAISRPLDTGGFKIATLPPGEYLAIAVPQLDLNDWQDPSVLESLSRLTTPFVLTPGDSRALELRLAAAP